MPFIRYVKARYEESRREMMYRFYVTDGLKALAGFNQRYYDLVKEQKVETRSAEEIKESIMNKLKGG